MQVAVGGMHCAALTHDNKILTWGVNDHSALRKDTQWNSGLVDIDDINGNRDANKSDSDTGLNPKEATPAPVDTSGISPGTIFAQIVAGDSSTFALTQDVLVYGWGTFKVSSPNTLHCNECQ